MVLIITNNKMCAIFMAIFLSNSVRFIKKQGSSSFFQRTNQSKFYLPVTNKSEGKSRKKYICFKIIGSHHTLIQLTNANRTFHPNSIVISQKRKIFHLTLSFYLVQSRITFLQCTFYSKYSITVTDLVCNIVSLPLEIAKLIHYLNHKEIMFLI